MPDYAEKEKTTSGSHLSQAEGENNQDELMEAVMQDLISANIMNEAEGQHAEAGPLAGAENELPAAAEPTAAEPVAGDAQEASAEAAIVAVNEAANPEAEGAAQEGAGEHAQAAEDPAVTPEVPQAAAVEAEPAPAPAQPMPAANGSSLSLIARLGNIKSRFRNDEKRYLDQSGLDNIASKDVTNSVYYHFIQLAQAKDKEMANYIKNLSPQAFKLVVYMLDHDIKPESVSGVFAVNELIQKAGNYALDAKNLTKAIDKVSYTKLKAWNYVRTGDKIDWKTFLSMARAASAFTSGENFTGENFTEDPEQTTLVKKAAMGLPILGTLTKVVGSSGSGLQALSEGKPAKFLQGVAETLHLGEAAKALNETKDILGTVGGGVGVVGEGVSLYHGISEMKEGGYSKQEKTERIAKMGSDSASLLRNLFTMGEGINNLAGGAKSTSSAFRATGGALTTLGGAFDLFGGIYGAVAHKGHIKSLQNMQASVEADSSMTEKEKQTNQLLISRMMQVEGNARTSSILKATKGSLKIVGGILSMVGAVTGIPGLSTAGTVISAAGSSFSLINLVVKYRQRKKDKVALLDKILETEKMVQQLKAQTPNAKVNQEDVRKTLCKQMGFADVDDAFKQLMMMQAEILFKKGVMEGEQNYVDLLYNIGFKPDKRVRRPSTQQIARKLAD